MENDPRAQAQALINTLNSGGEIDSQTLLGAMVLDSTDALYTEIYNLLMARSPTLLEAFTSGDQAAASQIIAANPEILGEAVAPGTEPRVNTNPGTTTKVGAQGTTSTGPRFGQPADRGFNSPGSGYESGSTSKSTPLNNTNRAFSDVDIRAHELYRGQNNPELFLGEVAPGMTRDQPLFELSIDDAQKAEDMAYVMGGGGLSTNFFPTAAAGLDAGQKQYSAITGSSGKYVDVGSVYDAGVGKINNTNWGDANTDLDTSADGQIAEVKRALLASSPYMSVEAAAGLERRIDNAALEWIRTSTRTGGSGQNFAQYMQSQDYESWM